MKGPRQRFARIVLVIGLLGVVGGPMLLRARRAADPSARVRFPAGVAPGGTTTQPQLLPVATKPRAAARPLPPAEESEPLPSSLAGTDVDGWLGVDDEGHLVVTPGARWFFDYFLSATGEESPEQIRARIVAEIDKRLPPSGAREAVDLLDRYLAYRDRVRALQASGTPADLQQRLAQLHDVRREIFGDANAAVLFGEEEQMEAVDLQRRHVLSDETLSPEERERRLGEIEQQLPAAVRQARSESMTLMRLRADEQQWHDAGASPEDLHALREQRFGAAVADRLDTLDRERSAWQQRLDDYHRARQAIDGNGRLSADARAQAAEALLAERFTPEERLRVEALETLQAANP